VIGGGTMQRRVIMADEQVIGITWTPYKDLSKGPGETTLAHRTGDDLRMPMRREDAWRMANALFGQDPEEVVVEGRGARWKRSASTP
jgi:hypothetical protein